MFNCHEIIEFAAAACALCVDRFAHLDLRINTSVVAVSFHGLKDQQNAGGKKAEGAYGRQYGIGVSTAASLGPLEPVACGQSSSQ